MGCSGIIQKYSCTSEMCSHCLLHLIVNAGVNVFCCRTILKCGELDAFFL